LAAIDPGFAMPSPPVVQPWDNYPGGIEAWARANPDTPEGKRILALQLNPPEGKTEMFYYRVPNDQGGFEYISISGDAQKINEWMIRNYGAGNFTLVTEQGAGSATHVGSVSADGTFTPGGSEAEPPPEAPFLESDRPLEAFTRFLGELGLLSPTPGRRQLIAEKQYQPLMALMMGQDLGRVGEMTGEPEAAWMDLLSSKVGQGQYPTVRRNDLSAAWGGMERRAAGGRGGAPLTSWQQKAFNPNEIEAGTPVANMGLQLLGRSMSPITSSYFNTPSASDLTSSYIGGQGRSPEDDFVEYVRNQLGLYGMGTDRYG